MSSDQISLDPDQALTSVTKLIHGQEVVAYVGKQVESLGTDVGPASYFKQALDKYVTDIRREMRQISQDLIFVEEKVTKTVVELVEKDAALADQTATFVEAVETVTTIKETKAIVTSAVTSVFGGGNTVKQ